MDTTKAVDLFQRNWFLRDVETPDLADAEEQLIMAAMGPEPKRWDGRPDVERMVEVLNENPQVLDRIGNHLLQVVVGMKGCGSAVTFLLDHDVPLEIDESVYNVLHEASWGGMCDTLRAVFESGAADATCVSVLKPHVGWPDNLSLMYWAACGGHVECAKLLIQYGVGVHHELPIKGNGERGTTSLQEAVALSHWGRTRRASRTGLRSRTSSSKTGPTTTSTPPVPSTTRPVFRNSSTRTPTWSTPPTTTA